MHNRIKYTSGLLVAFGLLLFVLVNPVYAQSLWTDTSTASNLFADRKAAAIGDIVTIIISESSSATRDGKASNSKSVSGDANVELPLKILGFNLNGSGSGSYSDKYNAQGSLSNTNKVSAKITTTIKEIRPNGYLVITGTQNIKQYGEEQKITISGVVRPDDIAADNTVLSTYVADAQIQIDGKGNISSKQRQGILTRLWGLLF